MKQILTVGLVIFILLIGSYFTIRYFATVADEDNWFNESWRESFARYPVVRDFFSLHWDGDGKTDYLLDENYTKLVFEVDSYDECELDESIFADVQEEAEKILQKPDGYEVVYNEELALLQGSYTNEHIRKLARRHQNISTGGRKAVFYVLCLNANADNPSHVGMTVEEDGIVLFYDTILDLEFGSSRQRDQFIASTILHEIGHQVGMSHIDDSRCIMSETVEVPDATRGSFLYVPNTWCTKELNAMLEIREQLEPDAYDI